jgi:hypothetical protein
MLTTRVKEEASTNITGMHEENKTRDDIVTIFSKYSLNVYASVSQEKINRKKQNDFS